MNTCDKIITRDIEANCDGLIQGAENEGLIINRDDVDFVASTFENGKLTLVLKNGKKAYVIKQLGKTPFTGTQDAFEEGTYFNTFSHTVSFVILDVGPEVSTEFIEPIANGTFIVILKTKNKTVGKDDDTEYRYKVYGYDQGLTMSEGTCELYNDDTLGGWSVTMQETKTPHAAIYLMGGETAYEALKKAVNAG